MRTHRALALFLVTGLVVASCGGDGDKGATTTVPSSTAPTSTGPSTAGGDAPIPPSSDPARAERAKAAILQGSDLPPGWKEQEPGEGLDLEIAWADLTRCLGVERTGRPLGIATSPTYLRGLATQTRSTVEYMPEPSVQAISTALAGPKFNGCATDAFTADSKRSAPEGGVPGPVRVAPLDFVKLGQTTSATRINVEINLAELQVPVFQDLVVVLDGEKVIRMTFLNPGGPFPPELERSLVEKVVGRA